MGACFENVEWRPWKTFECVIQSHDYIALTPFPIMCVLYVTQMLHNTMATDLQQFGTPNFHETAKFCKMFDHSLTA